MFDRAQAMTLSEIDEAFARAVEWRRDLDARSPRRG
jgi:hypothetical protein